MQDLHRLIDRVCDLVSLPDVYMRLKRVLADPDVDLASVAGVLEIDPAVTARLLRVANSPLFGLTCTVDTVSRAVMLLGLQRVHDLVLSTTIATMFKGMRYEAINVYDYWKQSVFRANVARALAQDCGISPPDRVFVLGLLSDIGHLVLYEQLARQMQAVYLHAEEQELPLDEAERHLLGFDYAEVGAALVRRWQMPEIFNKVIGAQISPRADAPYLLETCVIHIANHAAGAEPFDPMACRAALAPVAMETIEPTTLQLTVAREEAAVMVAETLALIYS